MLNIDIFISHSSQDAEIAEALINLLRAALNIPAERIRCTSVVGYQLPVGVNTNDRLRMEIHEAKAFIGLITSVSLQSTYVLFELGARWGAELHLAPVLAAGSDASILKPPLSNINALSCDVTAQIHQLIRDIGSALKTPVGNPASYQKQVDMLTQISKRRGDILNASKTPPPLESSDMTRVDQMMDSFESSEKLVEVSQILKMLEMTVSLGTLIYNSRDHKRCAEIYFHAAKRLLVFSNNGKMKEKMKELMKNNLSNPMMNDYLGIIYNELNHKVNAIHSINNENANKIAWDLRHAFDHIYRTLSQD